MSKNDAQQIASPTDRGTTSHVRQNQGAGHQQQMVTLNRNGRPPVDHTTITVPPSSISINGSGSVSRQDGGLDD